MLSSHGAIVQFRWYFAFCSAKIQKKGKNWRRSVQLLSLTCRNKEARTQFKPDNCTERCNFFSQSEVNRKLIESKLVDSGGVRVVSLSV